MAGRPGVALASRSSGRSEVGKSDPDFPDKRKVGHKLFLQMICPFFFQQGEQSIWEHLQPAPAVIPAHWRVQGGQESGREGS